MVLHACHHILHCQFHYPHIKICHSPTLSGYLLSIQYVITGKLNLKDDKLNTLNAELNPICYLLALLGAHHFVHVSRIGVKSLTLRLLMSYIYIWSAYS